MKYDIELDGTLHRVDLIRDADGNGWRVTLNGKACSADAQWVEPNILSLLIAGKSYRILYDPRSDGTAMMLDARRIPYSVADPRSLRSRLKVGAAQTGARSITAPMPGRIVRILVQQGDSVEAHQGLLVMEAMKMQNELKSPNAGTVMRILVESNATVQPGQVLLVIE